MLKVDKRALNLSNHVENLRTSEGGLDAGLVLPADCNLALVEEIESKSNNAQVFQKLKMGMSFVAGTRSEGFKGNQKEPAHEKEGSSISRLFRDSD